MTRLTKIRPLLFASLLAIPLTGVALAPGARAGEEPDMLVLRVENGHFEPTGLVVKAKTPIRLKVVNQDEDAIEFESFDLNRERVVAPGQEVVVYLPALDPGTYEFFDDFHRDAGTGTIQAR